MSEIGESDGMRDVAEANEITETPEAASEIDDDISSKYDEYLDNNKAQEFEHKSAVEKDVDEATEIKGGSYKDIKENMTERGETGEQYEVHHTPADSCTELNYTDGPAVKMEKADHRETASYGASRDAQEYRGQQKEFIDSGRFDDAVQMDIDDIQGKFGDKYDDGIAEMREYCKRF